MNKKTLIESKYAFDYMDNTIYIIVNEEVGNNLGYKPIFIEDYKQWRAPEEAIEYYQFVIDSIKKMDKEGCFGR